MQNFKSLLACLIITLNSTVACAQYDFFYSSQAPGGGVINGYAGICIVEGLSGSLYMYYTTDNSEIDTGAFIDISTSHDGIINITNVETLEFDVTVNGIPAGHRWTTGGISGAGGAFGPGTISADHQQASFNAFTVSGGTGIVNENEGPVSVDSGYDVDADAFLFARIDFDTVRKGQVKIRTLPGNGGIVHDGNSLNPSMGPAFIQVVLFSCGIGDVNQDGFVNLLDVDSFVALLLEGGYLFEADINQDGLVDLQDVDPFVDLLTGSN